MIKKINYMAKSYSPVPGKKVIDKVNELVDQVNEGGGGEITVDPQLDPTSKNPVENRQIYAKFVDVETEIGEYDARIDEIAAQVTNHGSAITQLQNSIVQLTNTKEDKFDVRSPVKKSGSMLTVDVTDTVEQGNNLPVSSKGVNTAITNAQTMISEQVAQDIQVIAQALRNEITQVDNKFNGCKIVGRWVGKLNISSVVKYNGNLTVQQYGTSNPGLYLLSGFNVDYQKRAVIMQQYHAPEMVLVKPQETTAQNQLQFTANKPDGSQYSGDVRVDIIVLQIQ